MSNNVITNSVYFTLKYNIYYLQFSYWSHVCKVYRIVGRVKIMINIFLLPTSRVIDVDLEFSIFPSLTPVGLLRIITRHLPILSIPAFYQS